MSKRSVITATVAVILAMCSLVFWRNHQTPAETVDATKSAGPLVVVTQVARQDIEEHVEAIGTTASWESIEIRPALTDFISSIHFQDGQLVKQGDPLVTLVQQEELAKRDEARAFLAEQVREVNRIEGLVASKSLSRNQLDERRTLLDIARTRVAVAEAALADHTIVAPFDGVLGLRNVSPGALVNTDTVITTLDDIALLRLDFPVPSMLLSVLRLGSDVHATTPALEGQTFSGTVMGIASRVDPVDRSVMVRARLDNSGLRLKPGMLLNVELLRDRRNGLVIPEEAIIQYQRDHFVLRVDLADGNRVQKRPIGIGTRQPGFVEVRSGLAEGDTIVVEGITVARPGQPVRFRTREQHPATANGTAP